MAVLPGSGVGARRGVRWSSWHPRAVACGQFPPRRSAALVPPACTALLDPHAPPARIALLDFGTGPAAPPHTPPRPAPHRPSGSDAAPVGLRR